MRSLTRGTLHARTSMNRSLSNVDEAFINDELLCTLVAHIVDLEARYNPQCTGIDAHWTPALVALRQCAMFMRLSCHCGDVVAGGRRGPEALLEGWSPNDSKAGTGSGGQGARSAGAILVFLPGAPEISRLQRALGDNAAVRTACDAGGCQLRVLPLHGALPTSQQVTARFLKPPLGNIDPMQQIFAVLPHCNLLAHLTSIFPRPDPGTCIRMASQERPEGCPGNKRSGDLDHH